jgi:hypothetical protein
MKSAVTVNLVLAHNGRVPISLGGKRYKKDLIRIGHYVKAADNIEFDVDGPALDHFVSETRAFLANGNKVPLPNTHVNADNPKENNGWMVDLMREGDTLFGVFDVVDESALKKTDVSIFTPPEFTDGAGVKYVRPITHVAFCTNPVIPGLGDFVPLAASLSTQRKSNMDWTKVKEALGITEDMTDDNAIDIIIKAAGEMKDYIAQLEEAATKPADNAKPVAASRDPLVIKLMGDNRRMRLVSLVAKNKVTPAVAASLAKQFVEEKALTLSLATDPTGTNFEAVVKSLEENDVVALGEKSKPQVVELSHTSDADVHDPKKNPLLANANARAGVKA